ncbi:hypothetical protein M441DRAFT_242337 [Trichoderma asperellum CBS 433.97]|uniref:Uncharacterized protein n=1 Tax=Trichoderma asperellum (strain ATCC 204424 / CBS 433.97 / NBRC 101777) TaxID=1042311 RepID=A0A2T3Z2C1_TRIA4|nr:hypothetical protein M441DRAFT_242337 [Trichoderma asperellum CBS 433.97]PTB38961.1 hypothetical protein M441DRAFT_242337 [Trichoderma asperellum CBS 433.97]
MAFLGVSYGCCCLDLRGCLGEGSTGRVQYASSAPCFSFACYCGPHVLQQLLLGGSIHKPDETVKSRPRRRSVGNI